jgi:excisionase family DNA binding protein
MQPVLGGLLTIREAMGELRLSRGKIYQLMKTKKLSFVKVDRRRFVPRDGLESFLRARIHGPGSSDA